MPDSDVAVKIRINEDIALPPHYSVIYINDDKTSASYVADSLIRFFKYSVEESVALTEIIDTMGSGVAVSGISKDIASHISEMVMTDARENGFPLKVLAKPE